MNNLLSKPLYLHISTLNLLYYSLVDIVESATIPDRLKQYHLVFKAALYQACNSNIETVTSILSKYRYPNISHEHLIDFVKELMDSIAPYKKDRLIGPTLELLHKFLKIGAEQGKLPFITEQEDHMLIEGLMSLYARPIYMYINSEHIFDNESEIKQQLEAFPMFNTETPLSNYSFLDSKDDKLIQVCDVTIGLIGKFFQFLNTHSKDQIHQKVCTMTEIQLENLDMLLSMFEKSLNFNEGLIHYIDSFETQNKISQIGKLREIKLDV